MLIVIANIYYMDPIFLIYHNSFLFLLWLLVFASVVATAGSSTGWSYCHARSYCSWVGCRIKRGCQVPHARFCRLRIDFRSLIHSSWIMLVTHPRMMCGEILSGVILLICSQYLKARKLLYHYGWQWTLQDRVTNKAFGLSTRPWVEIAPASVADLLATLIIFEIPLNLRVVKIIILSNLYY